MYFVVSCTPTYGRAKLLLSREPIVALRLGGSLALPRKYPDVTWFLRRDSFPRRRDPQGTEILAHPRSIRLALARESGRRRAENRGAGADGESEGDSTDGELLDLLRVCPVPVPLRAAAAALEWDSDTTLESIRRLQSRGETTPVVAKMSRLRSFATPRLSPQGRMAVKPRIRLRAPAWTRLYPNPCPAWRGG